MQNPKPAGKPAIAVTSDATSTRANALLGAIERELGEAAFFTREDLLHTSALAHVATITRYSYVREAVKWLLERDKLLAVSKTELCRAGHERDYRGPEQLIAQYRETVHRMVRTMAHGGDVVTVRDVLDAWQTDPHLTMNAKRVIARKVMQLLARDGLLTATGEPGSYTETPDD